MKTTLYYGHEKDDAMPTNENQIKELLFFRIASISRNLLKGINMQLSSQQIPLLAEQIPILLMICDESNLVTQQFLADKLHRDKGGIHRSIKALNKGGFLSVTTDPVDKRKNIVTLTPAGNFVCDKVKVLATNFNNQLLASLDLQEQTTLMILLEKVSATIEKHSLHPV